MILVNTKKLQVGDIDVYPDHDKTLSQVWYVPGTIRLAERNKRKALSYFWYSELGVGQRRHGLLEFRSEHRGQRRDESRDQNESG